MPSQIPRRPPDRALSPASAPDFFSVGAGRIEALLGGYKSHRFRPHYHVTFAIGIALTGRHRLWCEGRTWEVEPGDVVVVPPRALHSCSSGTGAGGWTLAMVFPPASVIGGTAMPAAHQAPLLPRSPFGRRLANELTRLRGDPAHPAGVALQLSADIVAALARTTILPDPGHDRRIRVARERLDDWENPTLEVSKLGREVGLHPSYLAALFRQAYGLTPYAYWHAGRIERARHHLRAGAQAGQVAHRLGFADQSHFTRAFRRAVGVPPGTYGAGIASVTAPGIPVLEKF